LTRKTTRNKLTLIRKIRDNTPPPIDLRELKALIAQLFHSDPRVLAQLDRIDLTGMGYEKSTSVRTKPNPTTGQNLSECLGWSDLVQIVSSLEKAEIYCLGCWVKQPIWDIKDLGLDLKALSDRQKQIRAEEFALLALPFASKDRITDAIKALIKKIYPYF
jgi:hypothetical protein